MAILGNLLILCAVYHNHRLRTIPNIFVTALAVSDILMSTICMPFTVASLFHGRWIFHETVCRFQAFDIFAFGTSSLGTMAAIAVSRYFCVVNRETWKSFGGSQRQALLVIVASGGELPSYQFQEKYWRRSSLSEYQTQWTIKFYLISVRTAHDYIPWIKVC